jgi:hypothetical protein
LQREATFVWGSGAGCLAVNACKFAKKEYRVQTRRAKRAQFFLNMVSNQAVLSNTLQPMFILWHLQHAAQTIKPNGLPRLRAAYNQ